MNKLIIIAFALALCICVNSQDIHNGTGLNYTNAYAYVRLQNVSANVLTNAFNYSSFMIVVTTAGIAQWKDENLLAAKYYNESYNSNFAPNITGLSNDLYVQRVNLQNNTSFNLRDNFTGDLQNPFDFYLVEFSSTKSKLKVEIPLAQNCSYFTIMANVSDQIIQANCSSIVNVNINTTLLFNLTISLPRLVNLTNTNNNYQIRLSQNESVLNQYLLNNYTYQQQNSINFPYLIQNYQSDAVSTYINPSDQFQSDRQCNISATFSFKNGTYVDPCFTVYFEGSKRYTKFLAQYYCANNLTVNDLNNSVQTHVYYVQSNSFDMTYIEETFELKVRQFVSRPQKVVVGYGLHACTSFASLLSIGNVFLFVLVSIIVIFA